VRTDGDDRNLDAFIASGDVEAVERYLLRRWPVGEVADLGQLALTLRRCHQVLGVDADRLYRKYAAALTAVTPTITAIRGLAPRTEVVRAFDGDDAAHDLIVRHMTELDDALRGYPMVLLGWELMRRGDPESAVSVLREALELSEQDVDWYGEICARAMSLCFLRLGEPHLSFEYQRISCMKTAIFARPRPASGSLQAHLTRVAMLYGHLDYVIEMQSQVAEAARGRTFDEHAVPDNGINAAFMAETGVFRASRPAGPNYLWAVHAEHQVALLKAELGLTDGAAERFESAAADAERHGGREGEALRWMSVLMALWLRDDLTELPRTLNQVAGWYPAEPARDLLTGADNDAGRWHAALRLLVPRDDDGTDERQAVLTAAALLARSAEQRDDRPVAVALYEVILQYSPPGLWLFSLVARRLIDILLAAADEASLRRALAIGTYCLEGSTTPMASCGLRARLARGHFLQGRSEQAWSYAESSIGLWKRITGGLYDRQSKIGWLRLGAPIIDLAIHLLAESQDWIEEDRRLDRLFWLTELGRARFTVDAISRQDRLPGPFFLTQADELTSEQKAALERDAPDWHTAVVHQAALLNVTSAAVVHWGNDWSAEGRPQRSVEIDLTPFRAALRVPLHPERLPLVSVEPVTFADAGPDIDWELLRVLEDS
jgi:tetratricopeptide (TPR) repeat protein